MGLSKFPDTLLPVILHFDSNIGIGGHLGIEVSLVRCHQFPSFAIWLIAYILVLVMVDLIEISWIFTEAFLAVESHGKEWIGFGEKDERQTGYTGPGDSGEVGWSKTLRKWMDLILYIFNSRNLSVNCKP